MLVNLSNGLASLLDLVWQWHAALSTRASAGVIPCVTGFPEAQAGGWPTLIPLQTWSLPSP